MASTEQKRRHVERYLRAKADDGPVFVKSKFMAEELPLSAREIGSVLGKIEQADTTLQVEKWSYTSATTWRVECR